MMGVCGLFLSNFGGDPWDCFSGIFEIQLLFTRARSWDRMRSMSKILKRINDMTPLDRYIRKEIYPCIHEYT